MFTVRLSVNYSMYSLCGVGLLHFKVPDSSDQDKIISENELVNV